MGMGCVSRRVLVCPARRPLRGRRNCEDRKLRRAAHAVAHREVLGDDVARGLSALDRVHLHPLAGARSQTTPQGRPGDPRRHLAEEADPADHSVGGDPGDRRRDLLTASAERRLDADRDAGGDEPSLAQSTPVAEQRVAGALIGALVAALVLLTVPNKPVLDVTVIVLFALATAIRGVNYAFYIAAMARGVLIGIDIPHPTDFSHEALRVLYTFLGVGLAVLVIVLADQLQKPGAKAAPQPA